MRTHFVMSVLLATSCTDGFRPIEDQQTAVAEGETPAEEEPPAPQPPTLHAFFLYGPSDCDDHSVWFETHVFYDGPGDIADGAVCQYTFPDGSVVDGCGIPPHPVPVEGGIVTLTAHDPATGATATFSDSLSGPESFTANLDVTTDGLSITWHAEANYGQWGNVGSVFVQIDPADQVIVDNPALFREYDGTVHVTEAGTYTVRLFSAITFAELGSCSAQDEATIEVVCDPH